MGNFPFLEDQGFQNCSMTGIILLRAELTRALKSSLIGQFGIAIWLETKKGQCMNSKNSPPPQCTLNRMRYIIYRYLLKKMLLIFFAIF